MGATIADAVLQAGTSYDTVVRPRVTRILESYPGAVTTSAFWKLLHDVGPKTVLSWRHHEKPNRVVALTAFLREAHIETEVELGPWLEDEANQTNLLSLRGIGPKTVDYLRILAGAQTVAVDRYVYTLLAEAGIHVSGYEEARAVLNQTADTLGVPRATLDHSVWRFMSTRKGSAKTKTSAAGDCPESQGRRHPRTGPEPSGLEVRRQNETIMNSGISDEDVAAALVLGLASLNRSGVTKPAAYLLLGVPLWVAVLKSGVHATLAGVVVAMFIPLRVPEKSLSWTAHRSPVHHLEHALHPWVAFGVLPIFAFTNAGVSIQGVSISDLLHPVPLGIVTGLLLGKQAGIMAMSWVAVRMGIASLPAGVRWPHIYGTSLLCGIGFTMSLFIASLAFEQGGAAYLGLERLGVLTASVLAGLTGYGVLRFGLGDRRRPT